MVPPSEQKVVKIPSFDFASVWAWNISIILVSMDVCPWYAFSFNKPCIQMYSSSHFSIELTYSIVLFMVMPFCWTPLIKHCSSSSNFSLDLWMLIKILDLKCINILELHSLNVFLHSFINTLQFNNNHDKYKHYNLSIRQKWNSVNLGHSKNLFNVNFHCCITGGS